MKYNYTAKIKKDVELKVLKVGIIDGMSYSIDQQSLCDLS